MKSTLAMLQNTYLLCVLWNEARQFGVLLLLVPKMSTKCKRKELMPMKRTQFITLPLLHDVLCTCLVLAITGALKVFDLPWVMFGAGMPENRGWLTGTYMYDQTFNKMNVDYGSTIAVLIVVLGVVLSNIANRVFRPSEDL